MPASSEPAAHAQGWGSACLRHRRKVIAWCLLAIGLSVGALFVLPRKYSSQAKLFMRLGRENVAVDPTATTGKALLQVQETREAQITSIREMMKSRTLLESVVKDVGAEAILHGPTDDGTEPSWSASFVSRLKQIPLPSFSPPLSAAEQAVKKLQKSLAIGVARNSSVIDVSFTAKTPQMAQQLLQAFLNAYDHQHLAANQTAGSVKFFSAQSVELKKQLDDANEALRVAKNQSKIVSVPAEQKSLQDQVGLVESARLSAETALAAAEASNAELKSILATTPETMSLNETQGLPNQAADYMRQDLYKLQISLQEMESKWGDSHPSVIALRNQVKASEAIFAAQPVERKQLTTGINPARQTLELELQRGEALTASLRAKIGTLDTQLAQLHSRGRDLNEFEVRISNLERTAAIAAANYRNYVDHLEQARIGEALEANRISNVNVVQPPTLVYEPISPQPSSILGAGLFAAIAGSLLIVFGSEHFTRARHVQPRVGLPTYSPALRPSAEHVVRQEPSWAEVS